MILQILDQLRDAKRRKIWHADLASGRRGEDLAHRYLRKQGFIVVARNYRLAAGDAEADIIAYDGGDLVIVEVKSRASLEFGAPERAIGEMKQAALLRVARAYGKKAEIPMERIRFDVITVILSDPPVIEHFRSAFALALRASR